MSSIVNRIKKMPARKKSLMFSILSGIGVVATGIVSAKCAKKVALEEDMPAKEKVKAYVPAVVTGGATIGCIAMSSHISGEEIAALTVGMVALNQRFIDYKQSVRENVSEEELSRIDETFYLKEIERLENELAERERPTEDENLSTFVDSFTGYTFKADKAAVEAGVQKCINFYDENEYLCWCDIFYFLNDGDTAPHDSVVGSGYYAGRSYHQGYGWSKGMFDEFFDKDLSFDMGIFPMKGRENTYLIDYAIEPEIGFEEY